MIFGLGTDIIEVERVEEKLERTPGLKTRLFTKDEIAYCESKHHPAQHFAARFAAKEACLKALGTGWSGGLAFHEVEVVHDASGKPELRVRGNVAAFCRDRGIAALHVSMSHLRSMSTAIVILEATTERN